MPNEQPEAKPYPAPYQHGFCPFVSLYMPAPGGANVRKLMPCDPADCQLGIEEEQRCSIKDLAATSNALYLAHCNQDVANVQLRQVLEQLSNRLGANLQNAHDNNRRLIDLAKSLDESNLGEQLGEIDASLQAIHAQLERLNLPTETAETT